MADVGTPIETLEKPNLLKTRLPSSILTPENQEPPRIPTIDEIANSDRWAVIHHAVDMLDKGIKPSTEIVQALFSRTVLDLRSGYFFRKEEKYLIPFPNRMKARLPLTWPAPAVLPRLQRYLLPESDYDASAVVIKNGVSQTFANGLPDNEDCDAMAKVAFKTLESLNIDQMKEVTDWLFDKLQDRIPEADRLDFIFPLLKQVNQLETKREFFPKAMDYIYKNRGKYHYTPYEYPVKIGNPLQDLIFELSFSNLDNCLEAIAAQDEEKARILLGMFINNNSFPRAINSVRQLLKDPDIPFQSRVNLERLGKILLGFDPDSETSFHTSLNSVYAAVEFEKYPPNLSANEDDLKIISTVIKQIGPNGVVVDLGTGTGRISKGLKRNGVENPIIGIDISPENLRKATAEKQEKDPAFLEASWYKIPLAEGKAKLVTSIGRCLPHAEEGRNFEKVIKEANRILAPEGIFLFDLPNPDKGEYLAGRKQFINFLRNAGIPIDELGGEEEILKYTPYVIDSPDGINFYNRFVPPIEAAIAILKRYGFEAEVISRRPIAYIKDGQEIQTNSENVYIKAVKKAELNSADRY